MEPIYSVMSTKISIVIPTFNKWELAHQLLFDLYQFNRDVYEVLIINNGSTELDYFQGLEWWRENKMLSLRVLEMEENVGFLRACNAGVRAAKGDVIILVSNDVRIKENITKNILDILSKSKSIIGGKYYLSSTGWNEFDGQIFPYLEGWLLAFEKEGWNEIGCFDEIFAPNDYEDVDFSTAALAKGYTLVELAGSKITHLGSQTISYGPEREAITKQNREKFRKKWVK